MSRPNYDNVIASPLQWEDPDNFVRGGPGPRQWAFCHKLITCNLLSHLLFDLGLYQYDLLCLIQTLTTLYIALMALTILQITF